MKKVFEKIDEAIAKYKEITNTDANCPAHCNISCDMCVQESEQILEWLEELKELRATSFGYRKEAEQYNNAIIDNWTEYEENTDGEEDDYGDDEDWLNW